MDIHRHLANQHPLPLSSGFMIFSEEPTPPTLRVVQCDAQIWHLPHAEKNQETSSSLSRSPCGQEEGRWPKSGNERAFFFFFSLLDFHSWASDINIKKWLVYIIPSHHLSPASCSYQETILLVFPRPREMFFFMLISKTEFVTFQRILWIP